MVSLHPEDIEAISKRTAELVLKEIYSRNRDEISMNQICSEYGISKETIRRRVKNGILPEPIFKRGENIFPRSEIVKADLQGVL